MDASNVLEVLANLVTVLVPVVSVTFWLALQIKKAIKRSRKKHKKKKGD